jgi:hypothetical protein
MEQKEWTYVDKSNWGDGPWQEEPDKMQFIEVVTSYPCLIVRGPMGALCGYVGVNKTHPTYMKNYNDINVDVHGGLTFANICSPNKEHGICHIVEEGEDDDVWWLGFDCAHAGDMIPNRVGGYRWYEDQYRDLYYVMNQCVLLARQLKELENGQPSI